MLIKSIHIVKMYLSTCKTFEHDHTHESSYLNMREAEIYFILFITMSVSAMFHFFGGFLLVEPVWKKKVLPKNKPDNVVSETEFLIDILT